MAAGGESMKEVVPGVVSIALLLAVSSPSAQAQESVVFRTIAQGSLSGIHVSNEFVVRTRSEWQALWRRHTTGTPQPRAALPEVDFSRDIVIAVFAGEVPAGSRFGIVKITQQTGRLVAQIQVRGRPGPEPVDVAPVTPFHIIRLARFPLPVVFVKTKVDLD